MDLNTVPGLAAATAANLRKIQTAGIVKAVEELLEA